MWPVVGLVAEAITISDTFPTPVFIVDPMTPQLDTFYISVARGPLAVASNPVGVFAKFALCAKLAAKPLALEVSGLVPRGVVQWAAVRCHTTGISPAMVRACRGHSAGRRRHCRLAVAERVALLHALVDFLVVAGLTVKLAFAPTVGAIRREGVGCCWAQGQHIRSGTHSGTAFPSPADNETWKTCPVCFSPPGIGQLLRSCESGKCTCGGQLWLFCVKVDSRTYLE